MLSPNLKRIKPKTNLLTIRKNRTIIEIMQWHRNIEYRYRKNYIIYKKKWRNRNSDVKRVFNISKNNHF